MFMKKGKLLYEITQKGVESQGNSFMWVTHKNRKVRKAAFSTEKFFCKKTAPQSLEAIYKLSTVRTKG